MGGPADIDGKSHSETDNFLPCKFVIDGVTYTSAENYFQCSKTTNQADRDMVLNSGAGCSAWAAGQKIKIRSDWETVKVDEMYKGNLAKFQQNEDLRNKLIGSGNGKIRFTGSTPFWNKWNGMILERIRAELRQNGDEDAHHAAELRDAMEKFAQGKE
jgi:N-glycosidase YbiA